MNRKNGNKLSSIILTTILVLSIFAAMTTVSTSALSVSDKEIAIDNGSDWLIAHQSDNGGWTPFLVSTNNALAIRAYIATENTSSPKYALLLAKLKELQASDGSWDESVGATSEAICALIESGEAPNSVRIRNAVSWLKGQQNTDGGWGAKGFESYPSSTSAAMIALIKAGEAPDSKTIVDGANWLLVTQNHDGYWGYYAGDDSKWNIHPSPVIALCLCGYQESTEVQNAISYLVSQYRVTHDLLLVSEAFIIANMTSEIQKAISDIVSMQKPDGGWGWFNPSTTGPSRSDFTAWGVIYLAKAGYTGQALDRGMTWIENHVSSDGVFNKLYKKTGLTAWCTAALSKSNASNATLAAQKGADFLIQNQNGDGGWYLNLYGGSTPRDTGPVCWLLGVYGLPPTSSTLKNAASYLTRTQNSDGGWGCFADNPSELSYTIYATLGLTSAGYTTTSHDLIDALNYISAQSTDGNWGNTFYTALATIILKETGYNDTLLNNSIDWLRANQNEDGGWGSVKGETSTVSDTSLALIALNYTGETGLVMARGASWLIAAQNDDGGWSNLPGIPCSNPSNTARAIWALSVANYTLEIPLNLTLDKESYYQGETVTINVSSPDVITVLNGTVTDPNGNSTNLSFVPFDSNFTAKYEIATDATPGTYTVNVIAQSLNGTGTATKNFYVLRLFPPTVSITTDKTMYHPDDTMNTTICLSNPSNTSQPVVFRWWLTIPKFSYTTIGIATMPLTLPANYDECFMFSIDVKYWSDSSFGAIWGVGLFGPTTDEIIDYDTSGWNYMPSLTAQEKMTQADIAEQIKKTIERVELPS